jgi:hypothetical protein
MSMQQRVTLLGFCLWVSGSLLGAPYVFRYDEMTADHQRPHLRTIAVTTDRNARVLLLGSQNFNETTTPDHFGEYQVTLSPEEYALILETLGNLPETQPTFGPHESSCAITKPPSDFQNLLNPLDADGDGEISSMDSLTVINHINAGMTTLSPSNPRPPFLDVDGNNQVSANDSLTITNAKNAGTTNTYWRAPNASTRWKCNDSAAWPSENFRALIQALFERASVSPVRNMRLSVSSTYRSGNTFTASVNMKNEGTKTLYLSNPNQPSVFHVLTSSGMVPATVSGGVTGTQLSLDPAMTYAFNVTATVPTGSVVSNLLYSNYSTSSSRVSTFLGYAISNLLNVAAGDKPTGVGLAALGLPLPELEKKSPTKFSVPPVPSRPIFEFHHKHQKLDVRDVLTLYTDGLLELESSGVRQPNSVIGKFSMHLNKEETEKLKRQFSKVRSQKGKGNLPCQLFVGLRPNAKDRSWKCGERARSNWEKTFDALIARAMKSPHAVAALTCRKSFEDTKTQWTCDIRNDGSLPISIINPFAYPDVIQVNPKSLEKSPFKITAKSEINEEEKLLVIGKKLQLTFSIEPQGDLSDIETIRYDSQALKHKLNVSEPYVVGVMNHFEVAQ